VLYDVYFGLEAFHFIYILNKILNLKCFTKDVILMYSGIELQIKVPEKNE